MDLIADHLDHIALRGLRPSTIAKRRHHLARFDAAIGLATATTADVERWLARPLSAKSRLTELSHLRAFYAWALLRKRLMTDPTATIESPRIPRYLPRPIDATDLRIAVMTARTPIRTWLVLAGWAGLRACEIAQLRVECLRFADRMIVIEESKGGSPSTVPMHSFVAEELESARLPYSGWCWSMPTDPRRHVTASRVSKLCNDHLRVVGGGATLHQLRHYFATSAYATSGGDLLATKELLRHATVSSTQIYAELNPARRLEVLDAMPALA